MSFLVRQIEIIADTNDDKIRQAVQDIQEKHGDSVFLRFSNTKSSRPKDLVKFGPIGALSLSMQDLLEPDLPPVVKKAFRHVQVIEGNAKKAIELDKLGTDTKVFRLLQKIFVKQNMEFENDDYQAQKEKYKKKNVGPFGKGFINHPQHIFMTFVRYLPDGTLRDPLEQAQLLLTAGYDAIYDPSFAVLIKKQKSGYLFLRPQAFQIVDTVDLGVASKVPQKTKVPKTLDPASEEVLARYTPDLSGANKKFQALKTLEEVKEALPDMSPDDIAWQLTHGNFAGAVDGHPETKKHIGLRESCFMLLQNKNMSTTAKNNIAEWMLDKAGVSFVGGSTLKNYILALAKRGDITREIQKDLEKDKLKDDIQYGVITDPDELRKFDPEVYDTFLCKNEHTPVDVLKKIAKKDGPTQWRGLNPSYGGVVGESTTIRFSDPLLHKNYPTKDLVKAYYVAEKKYPKPGSLQYLAATLLLRKDLPEDVRDDVVHQGGMVWDSAQEKWLGKADNDQHPFIPDQKALISFWKIRKSRDKEDENAGSEYATKLEYDLGWYAQNEFVTDEILREILDWPNRAGSDGESSISAITRAKQAAFKKLRERGALSDKEAADNVRKKLKFDGPDDLLAHFGPHAFDGTGKNKLKFTKVSDSEKDRISAQMQSEAAHDDFTFEVVAAYKFDKPLHKDFDETAKKISNVRKGLYHGTSCSNAAGILANGVNVDAESRTGAMFGAGFYLASVSSKAVQYASDSFSKEGFGVVFQLNAALGKSADWKFGRPVADEIQRRNQTDEEKARIKAYAKKHKLDIDKVNTGWHLDHDSVTARKGMALLHDEYVVKNGQQIQIELVILVKKTDKGKS